jgi:hypothetical protein
MPVSHYGIIVSPRNVIVVVRFAENEAGETMRNDTIELPPEYRFDVAKAARSVATLADSEPAAPMLLTIAQLGAGGMEAETEVRMRASEAAALLATVGEDQRLQAGTRELVVLRVARTEELPTRNASTDENQDRGFW